jgi:putative zinc finger protein
MTTQDLDHNNHTFVWEMLPWYVNDTLSASQTSQVEAHLTYCSACRRELERCRNIQGAIKSRREEWTPSARHFAEVVAQIERVCTPPRRSGWQAWHHWYQKVRALFAGTPGPIRLTLAFQGALVVVLAGALVLLTAAPPPSVYETLSRETDTAAGNGMKLRLVFADDMTEKELRGLLEQIGGNIVQGPSSVGAYTIRLASAAPATERVKQILDTCRADPKVRLAEVVTEPQTQQ